MKPSIGKVPDTVRGRIDISVEGLIRGRLLVYAMSGGGKGWAMTRLLEQTHPHVQQIVIDPEGEWYTLRKHFDYLLAGPGGDCEASPRSAKLLARSLMESKVSAILDLSDLVPSDQDAFVRNFLNGLMALPKKLWSPLVVGIDEAQRFAAQNAKTESLRAVNNFMSGGRKRGFCGVLITQRIAALSKDSIAQCQSLLVGRAVMDIDVNRAADALGFPKKSKKAQALKRLNDGEFHFFGPAFEGVEIDGTQFTLQIGSTKTKPIQIGKPAPPLAPTPKAIAKIAQGLANLPERAHAEIVDLVQAKTRILELEALVDSGETLKEVPKEDLALEYQRGHMEGVTSGIDQGRASLFEQIESEALGHIEDALVTVDLGLATTRSHVEKLRTMAETGPPVSGETARVVASLGDEQARRRDPGETARRSIESTRSSLVKSDPPQGPPSANGSETTKVTGPERNFLLAMSKLRNARIPSPWTKIQVAFIAGRSMKSSTTSNTFGSLRSKGFIEYEGGGVVFTTSGAIAVEPFRDGTQADIIESVKALLNKAERAFLEHLIDVHPSDASKERVAEIAGYSPTASTTSNAFGRLKSLQIITYPRPGRAQASEWLFQKGR